MYRISWHCRLDVGRRSMARCPREGLSIDTTYVSDANTAIASPLRNGRRDHGHLMRAGLFGKSKSPGETDMANQASRKNS
jgi:hypothetical protein